MHHANMPRIGLLGILYSSTALAAEPVQLAVVGVHDAELTPQDQQKVIDDFLEIIGDSGKAEGIHGTQVATSIQGREQIIVREALLSSGNQALQNGKNLYNQALPEDAIPVLEAAILQLEQGVIGANSTKALWEAHVYLGTSHQSLEKNDAAHAAFRAAAALNPSRAPNPALFPPFVIEAFNATRAEVSSQTTDLVVTVDESDATLYLNGEERGTGSTTIPGVLPGRHFLLARGSGKQAFQVVDVPAPGATAETPAPEETPAPASPPEEAPEAPADGTPATPAAPSITVDLTLGSPVLGTMAATPAARSRQIGTLYRSLGEHSVDVDLFLLAGVSEEWLYLQLYAPDADAFSKQVEIRYSGELQTEATQALPLLLNVLDKNGHLPTAATVPTAAPLDIGANAELATLLTQPKPLVTTGGGGQADKKQGVKPWAIVAGVVAAGALGGGGYGAYTLLKDDPSAGSGTVVIGPF